MKKRLLPILAAVILLTAVLCVPTLAITEAEVEAQVAASGKGAVTGNVLIWFLCAVAFLKVSQKIDSFLSVLGVNVGNTGGSMLGDAMVAMRTVSMMVGGGRGAAAGRAGASSGGTSGKSGTIAGTAGFFKGGLVGMAGRHITNSAVKTATTQTSAVHTAQQSAVHTAAHSQQTRQAGTDANDIEGGTLMGGMFKTRNVIEAGILGALTGLPVLKLPVSLTARVIILCLITLPLVLVALIGIGGGSLSEFILQFIMFLLNRRTLDRDGAGKKSLLPTWSRGFTREDDGESPKSRTRLQVGSREAITRRFFLIFEYESLPGTKRGSEEDEAVASLQTAARTAANYLRQCGNAVVQSHDDESEAAAEVLYHILCRQESNECGFDDKARRVVAEHMAAGLPVDKIPVNEFYAPSRIDFSHGNYICIDGVYYAYLLVPSVGYKAQVPAGWLSLLVNAGDGIDLDMFLTRQPKDRMIRKLGQQLRINRSKIKETSDTNTDFDDLDGAIRSGYLLKDGLSNNEDFYYLNLLVTITAANVEDLEWKCAEMKKLLLSQDMDVQTCSFCQEQAFLSSLPLVSLEKHLFERSKRNVLTLGAASCYPFTSYEMCDDNGILLGVNKHNNSLIIVDIFDSRTYKNANIAILGTSGAGKSFTMQLMATRMRRKGIQVFIVAPLKGHEFHRACSNIGGEFIQISPASKNCINVMEIRKVDKSVDELLDGPGVEKSLLAAKIQRLHIFFSLLIPDMNHEERQLLDDALIRTYAKLGITHENSTLDDPADPGRYRTMPVLGDLYEVLKESQETKRLANIINRLVHGSARTFNQQTNVSLDNKYTVLDISELTGDLLTVGMFVALDYVWDKAKENRTEEKAIYIDECWQLIGANSNRLAAVWVLVDFIDRVEYHAVGEFPAKIIFIADGEVYEIVHAQPGKETLLAQIMGQQGDEASRYLVLVDDPEQIGGLELPHVCGYCTVSPEGEVQYYQKE